MLILWGKGRLTDSQRVWYHRWAGAGVASAPKVVEARPQRDKYRNRTRRRR